MADSENTRTLRASSYPGPVDDPALAMCRLWHADSDRFEEAVTFAARREQELIDATSDAQHAEIEPLYLAAAKVRDHKSDLLHALAIAIFKTEAHTLEGIRAKLDVVLRDGEPAPDWPAAPWAYLRSVKADLDRFIASAEAAAIGPPLSLEG